MFALITFLAVYAVRRVFP